MEEQEQGKVAGEAKVGGMLVVYTRPLDKERLAKIAEKEKRSLIDQLSVLIDHYEATKG